jgi:hypothetical protein
MRADFSAKAIMTRPNASVVAYALGTIVTLVGLPSGCGGGGGGGGGAGSGGSNSTASTPASPTVTVSALPQVVASGATSTITWSSTNAASCTLSGSTAGGSGSLTGASGSFTTSALTSGATYTVTCSGTGGGSVGKSVTIVISSTIASAAAACAAEPMRGTVYYYCDCGTGADANCLPGLDTNAGTNAAAPRRTIADAVNRYHGLTGTNTIAFCKGGAFDAMPTNWLSLNNASCAAGTTCNDLREYAPTTFKNGAVPTAKPIINTVATDVSTFAVTGVNGGLRILNLSLKGSTGGATNGSHAFFFYRGAHDVTMCNLDMDAFDMPVYNESGGDADAKTTNIKLTGSNITNSRVIAYLGGGDNAEISYNNWDGNGSSNMFDHTIYLGTSKNISNVQVVGNYIHGQYGPTCLGAAMIAHASIDGLLVKDNIVALEATQTAPGCWGIGFNNNTNATHPQYYRNAVFSGNTVINGGNLGFTVSSCPGCVIENNVIIQNWASGGGTGISVPSYGANATRGDDVNTANVIRNNTVWFGPNSTGTSTGIDVNVEGTGYIVANNTVSSVQTTGTLNCFRQRLPLSSYAFINNNHCYSTVANKWETTQGTLAAWKTYAAAYGFDSASLTGDPLFTAPGTDFTPAAGSPLIGKGGTTQKSTYDKAGKTRPSPPAIGAYEP